MILFLFEGCGICLPCHPRALPDSAPCIRRGILRGATEGGLARYGSHCKYPTYTANYQLTHTRLLIKVLKRRSSSYEPPTYRALTMLAFLV